MTNKDLYTHCEFLVNNASKYHGKIGYAVARNIRKFQDALTEYISQCNKLILQYGENGELKPENSNFSKCLEEAAIFDEIENNPEIFKITAHDLQESDLSADIMLGMAFMTEDGD